MNSEVKYAGFWIRVWASIVDSALFSFIIFPILIFIYGQEYFYSDNFVEGKVDFFLNFVLPILAIIIFWIKKSATPGKMLIKAIIVDSKTYKKPSKLQFIGRYFAYIPSFMFLGIGIFWIAFDKRKQGWHDKLAGTVVIYKDTKE
jgi:uncharacterized RDD family membrane protein YckC